MSFMGADKNLELVPGWDPRASEPLRWLIIRGGAIEQAIRSTAVSRRSQ